MKTKDEIFKYLDEWLHTSFGFEDDELKPAHLLVDDLALDSLDLIDLAMEMEEEFRLGIPDEVAEGFKTLGDVVGYVFEHQREED